MKKRAALFLTFLAIISCGPREGRSNGGCTDIQGEHQVLAGHTVTVCTGSLDRIPGGRVQLLIDASGSMAGFSDALPNVARWVSHATSRIDGAALRVEEDRACEFNSSLGIGKCSTLKSNRSDLNAHASTNLDEAILSGYQYDLTFIVTDGVGAVGTGSGDCAGGVDAACVAHALLRTLKEFRYSGPDHQPGVWLVPLVTRFQGRHFSEVRAAAASVDPNEIVDRVRADLGVEPFVGRPLAGKDGTISYDYRGPKVMLLIIIAKDAAVGRQAVAALWERMTDVGVRSIPSFQDVPQGIGTLAPLEVYPGAIEALKWIAIDEVDEQNVGIGNVEASLTAGAQIRLQCQGKRSSGRTVQDLFVLSGRKRQPRGACTSILQLPPFQIESHSSRDEGSAAKELLLAHGPIRQNGGEQFEVEICLGCGDIPLPDCENLGVRWELLGIPRYQAWSTSSAASEAVRAISTVTPLTTPHAVYDLEGILRIFLSDVTGEALRAPIAQITFCR